MVDRRSVRRTARSAWAVALLLLVSGCNPLSWIDIRIPGRGDGRVIHGSGNVVTEERMVGDFERVALLGLGEVVLTQGEEASVTVEADDNLLPYVLTRVEDGSLILSLDEDRNFQTIDTLRFHVTVREIDSVLMGGAGDVFAEALEVERLEVTLAGMGKVQVDALDAEELIVRVNGTGDVELAGRATRQEIIINGMGNCRAAELESRRAAVTISGVGDVTLWARDELNVRIFGAGSVAYYGQPQVTQDVALAGRVVSLGDPVR